MKIQRYQWEDAITEAKTVGVLTLGEANLALALAHAINWEPKDGGDSELRWANELAADVVGVARMTYYRNVKGLKAAGYLLDGYNLRPAIPEYHNDTRELFVKRRQALVDAYNEAKNGESIKMVLPKYHNDTSKYQNDNPYTVDTYTVEDTLLNKNNMPPVADAPVDIEPLSNSTLREDEEDVEIVWDIEDHPLTTKEQDRSTNLDVETPAKYHNDTEKETTPDTMEDDTVYLTPGEERAWAGICAMYPGATSQQVTEAKRICSESKKGSIYEKAQKAFEYVGVDSEW